MALRSRPRLTSDHVPRIVDLSLLMIQSRSAVVEAGATRPTAGSPGADDVLTPPDGADADVPGSADGARERCDAADEDAVLLRKESLERKRNSASSCARPRKMSSLADQQSHRRSLPVKRHSEPTDLFWRSAETEHLVKRHSGPEGVLARGSAHPPRRRSVAELLLCFLHPDRPPAGLELSLKRHDRGGGSPDSDSSDASFHTALESPMREAPVRAPCTLKAELARARDPGPSAEPEAAPEKSGPGAQTGVKSDRVAADRPDLSPDAGRQRSHSLRQGPVSVRARIGQIERELGVCSSRPGGAGRQPPPVQSASRVRAHGENGVNGDPAR